MFERLKTLFTNTVIYGLGDVATSLVSFLLLPIFTRYLSPMEYGVIALLLTVEAIAKILFRWGVESAFIRLYYDCRDERARQVLASTLCYFLVAVNGALLAAALVAAPWLAELLFDTRAHTPVLRLVMLNTFVIGFYFIPLSLLRIQERARRFTVLAISRSAATVVGRLAFVAGAGLGVLGFVLADVVVTAVFTLLLVSTALPVLRPTFSASVLREALRFGLPRVPQGVAHQVVALSDRYFLSVFATMQDVGVYAIGAMFGLGLKLFLKAFQTAWSPFLFDVMDKPGAKRTYSVVTTYVVAALVLLAAGLSAVARDLVRLMTAPEFHAAAVVIPWVALGVVMQGTYQVTSVGLAITKRTKYYPIATGVAAVTSVSANLLPGISVLPAPDGPLYTRRAAERTKLLSSHIRPAPEAVTSARADVRPTGAPAFRAFLRHRSTRVPFLRQAGFVALSPRVSLPAPVAPRSSAASRRKAAGSDALPPAGASSTAHASPAAPRSSPAAAGDS